MAIPASIDRPRAAPRLTGWLWARTQAVMRRWRRHRAAIEMSELDDRMLADIGLRRADVVRAAYGGRAAIAAWSAETAPPAS